MNWLLTSKWGQSLILAFGMTVAAGLTYWYVSHTAYERGRADCQADQLKDINKANETQAAREGEQRAAATVIAKEGDEAAARAVSTTEAATIQTKEVIRNVYHEVRVPVAGSCKPSPLDDRVQQRIDKAVDSANGT